MSGITRRCSKHGINVRSFNGPTTPLEGGDYRALSQTQTLSFSETITQTATLSPHADRLSNVKCISPVMVGKAAFGCGRCTPCQFQRARMWGNRILLESLAHRANAFITLTYSDEHLPANGSLSTVDFRNWVKRYRKAREPDKFRLYGVGEYGDRFGRPHYHFAMFGAEPCLYFAQTLGKDQTCPCKSCSYVRQTWDYGRVSVQRLDLPSAMYIAGYVTKKILAPTVPRGVEPPFQRMSRRPGIGAFAIKNVALATLHSRWLTVRGDVPSSLMVGKAQYPLGTYLTRLLRKNVGISEKAPQQTLQACENQMQMVRAFAWANNRSVSSVFYELNEPFARALEAKAIIKANNYETLKTLPYAL